LSAVAADAHVDAFALAVKLLPDIPTGSFPSLCDGVADELNVTSAGIFPGALQHIVGALGFVFPSDEGGVRVNHRHGIGRDCHRRIRLRDGGKLRQQNGGGEREDVCDQFHAKRMAMQGGGVNSALTKKIAERKVRK
jgi:hypothetical protein